MGLNEFAAPRENVQRTALAWGKVFRHAGHSNTPSSNVVSCGFFQRSFVASRPRTAHRSRYFVHAREYSRPQRMGAAPKRGRSIPTFMLHLWARAAKSGSRFSTINNSDGASSRHEAFYHFLDGLKSEGTPQKPLLSNDESIRFAPERRMTRCLLRFCGTHRQCAATTRNPSDLPVGHHFIPRKL